MMIDAFTELFRWNALPSACVQAASVRLERLWLVMFSLTNEDSAANPIRFDDYEDIRQSQRGDADAYRRLVQRHQDHISKLLWRFTRDSNSHEELVQETFVQAYFSLGTYQAKAPFEHWLTRIATRVGYHFWRDRARHQHADLLDEEWDTMAEEDAAGMNPEDAAELLHRLLGQLPARDRLVLTLRYLEQCDVAETARRTGWSATMVKVQTHRAKQKLKKLAEKADMDIAL